YGTSDPVPRAAGDRGARCGASVLACDNGPAHSPEPPWPGSDRSGRFVAAGPHKEVANAARQIAWPAARRQPPARAKSAQDANGRARQISPPSGSANSKGELPPADPPGK